MSEKTQEQRIKDAADVIRRKWAYISDNNVEQFAKQVLEAADAPSRPTWPTDESTLAYRNHKRDFGYEPMLDRQPGDDAFELSRAHVRAALEVDPVIKAAVDYTNWWLGNMGSLKAADVSGELRRAVKEAGLLK